MRKELVISSIPQETRVAVLEDGELVEFLIERRRSQGIAGNIYKGRVTKVLPGMQSAFVDIGLERDAFLYVSDFLEDTDEYERMVATAEDEAFKDGASRGASRKVRDRDRDRSRGRDKRGGDRIRPDDSNGGDAAGTGNSEPQGNMAAAESLPEEDAAPLAPGVRSEPERGDRSRDDRSRDLDGERRSVRRGDRPQPKPRVPSSDSGIERRATDSLPVDRPADLPAKSRPLSVLPGESLAKYRRRRTEAEEAPRDAAPASAEAEDTAEAGAPVSTAEGRAPDVSSGSDTDVESAGPARADTSSRGAGDESSPRKEEPGRPGRSGDGIADSAADPADGAGSSEPDGTGAGDESSGGEVRRARIIDRGSDGAFTRRAPTRRPRRRPSTKPEDVGTENSGGTPTISDLLKEGQEILVQVSKEPLGKKGARITSHIALPGRYLVYMPTVDHVGVSRKIASDEERARLRKIIAENRRDLPGGFIVRTAAEGRDEKEFVQDLRFLFELWNEIREKSEKSSAPAVIHSDLGLVERVLRDQLSDEYRAIRLDSEVEYAKVLDFVSKFQPSLVNRVKLHLKSTPIFEEYGLQQEIEKAMKSKVWLKSGGYIVVNQTEALVAIDVNTGKFVGKSNRLEDTIVRTNLDAVHEIVRQIRLRNLGGIIVVDFIDMEERKNRQRVMQALEEELEKDRSPSKILQFNDFGLVAITRKRTQASLERVLGTPCPRCSGSGYVKAIETVCYEIQQELRKMLADVEGDEVTVRVGPEVAKALKSAEFVDFTELEEESRKEIRIQSDPMLPAERFDVYE